MSVEGDVVQPCARLHGEDVLSAYVKGVFGYKRYILSVIIHFVAHHIIGKRGVGVSVAAAQAQQTAASVSQGDLDLMAAIIECEAGGEPYEGKIGVGAVVMNRVRSSQFPNTISEVIYQSGQFSPVASGKLASVLSRGARQDCYDAARDVFAGANTVGDCLFFHAGGGSGLTIANQTFY